MEEPKKIISDETQQVSDSVENQETEDQVAYKTYSRVLGEKKKVAEENRLLKERIDAIEQEQQQKLEAELAEKQNWKKLAELKDAEIKKRDELIQQKQATLDQVEKSRAWARKANAFINALDGTINDQYLEWIPIDDNIVIDPETNEIDQMSVTNFVDLVHKKYPELVQRNNAARMPSAAPVGSKPITYEEWKKLPLKEMKARYKDVIKQE